MKIETEIVVLQDGTKLVIISDIRAVEKLCFDMMAVRKVIKELLLCEHGPHEIPIDDVKALYKFV